MFYIIPAFKSQQHRPQILFAIASLKAAHFVVSTPMNLQQENSRNQKFGLVLTSRRKWTHDRGPAPCNGVPRPSHDWRTF